VAVWITNGAGQEPPALDAVVINPEKATILIDGSCSFTGQAKDQYGQDIDENLTWTVSGGGTITNGSFTSNGTAGSFVVIASAVSDHTIKDSAQVIVLAEYAAPVAGDVNTQTTMNTPILQPLLFQCESSGPFEFTITRQPVHGTVSHVGNDATYTPSNGFVGTDAFKWVVTDLSNGKQSNEATVTVDVLDQLSITLVQYFGSHTDPTVQVDGFVNGATEANDRDGSQWTNVPAALNGLTYLLTARNDKSDPLGEDEVMYKVNASGPCIAYALIDDSVPAWITTDGWETTILTVTGDGQSYAVYKKEFPAGDIGLKRLKSGNSQGTSFVFKLAVRPSLDNFGGLLKQPHIHLNVHPNPFKFSTTISLGGLAGNRGKTPRLSVIDINGKMVARLTPKVFKPRVVWEAGPLAAGVYFVTLTLAEKTLTKKILLLK
jgi:hypothetical protein